MPDYIITCFGDLTSARRTSARANKCQTDKCQSRQVPDRQVPCTGTCPTGTCPGGNLSANHLRHVPAKANAKLWGGGRGVKKLLMSAGRMNRV